jgi:hypothetical protein
MKKPFVVSWSKLDCFETCEWLFWLQHGSKYLDGEAIIPFVESPALIKGRKIHDLFEGALVSIHNGNAIPDRYTSDPLWQDWWGPMLHKLTNNRTFLTEYKFGVDTNLKGWPVTKYYVLQDKKLFGKNVMWANQAFDLTLLDRLPHDQPTEAFIIDWKSGQYRETEGYKQLAMYALMSMCMWPSLQKVRVMARFVGFPPTESDNKQVELFTRAEDYDKLLKDFRCRIAKVHKALDEEEFMYPSGKCHHWCPATSEQCERSRK